MDIKQALLLLFLISLNINLFFVYYFFIRKDAITQIATEFDRYKELREGQIENYRFMWAVYGNFAIEHDLTKEFDEYLQKAIEEHYENKYKNERGT